VWGQFRAKNRATSFKDHPKCGLKESRMQRRVTDGNAINILRRSVKLRYVDITTTRFIWAPLRISNAELSRPNPPEFPEILTRPTGRPDPWRTLTSKHS
jgi:hypothetical protein